MTEFILTPIAEEHRSRNGLHKFHLVGFLDTMLNENNPEPAVRQLDAGYRHGGGWNSFQGFTFQDNPPRLRYPGDPPMRAIAEAKLRDERIILFESSWVAVVQPDGTFDVARMD